MKSYTYIIFFFIRLSSGIQNYRVNVTFHLNMTENVHQVAQEYQDLVNRRGRVDIQTGQKITKYYYYTHPWQVVSISDNAECRVDKDSDNEFHEKYTYFGWTSPHSHVTGPSAILFRKTRGVPLWSKRTIVRGILCDQYDAYDKEYHGIKISYYLPAPTEHWPTALKLERVIRVRSVLATVSFVWDFLQFGVDDLDSRDLQIPAGIGCENFESEDNPELPHMSPLYTFVAECRHPTSSYMISWRVEYDRKEKVMQIKENQNDVDILTEIQDLNTGILYHINELGKCTMGSIKDSIVGKNMTELVNIMKDPREMLELGSSFIYIGKDEVRDMDVDVWETIQENKVFWGIQFQKIVITFYYTQAHAEVVREGKENCKVPVMIRFSPHFDDPLAQLVGSFEINYFDFFETLDRDFYTKMNVKNCFTGKTQRNVFVLAIEGDNTLYETALSQVDSFEKNVVRAIRKVLLISPLRLPIIKASFEPDLILVRGLLLERPPTIKGFYILQDNPHEPNVGTETLTKEDVEDDCAVNCITILKDHCNGFTTCPAENSGYFCYLTTNTSEDNRTSEVKEPGCKFYARGVYSKVKLEVPLKSAITILHEEVDKQKLIIYLTNDVGDVVRYVPAEIETGLRIREVGELEKFLKVFDNRQLEKGVSLRVKEMVASTEECSKMCLDDKRVPCASFSFCHNTHECLISSHYIQEGKEHGTSMATSCVVYHRNAINFFDKMTGTMFGIQGELSTNKESPEECALACQDEKSFECRGFDYCPEEKTCSLSRVHQLDLPALSTLSSCNHYSRNYDLDFTIKDLQMTFSEGRSFAFEATPPKECAKLCIDFNEDQGHECKSFTSCTTEDETSGYICWINMDTADDPGAKVISGFDCVYYERKPESEVDLEILGDNVSDEFFNGILSGVFFLGIAVATSGLFFYASYKKKRNENINMFLLFSSSDDPIDDIIDDSID